MKAYYVRGVRRVEQEMETLADSPQDAAKRFREAFPGFNVDMVSNAHHEEWESIGICESCSKEIFEGDNYYPDDEGIDLCEECYERAMEAGGEE
jgi:hypothetical protein